MPPSRRPRVRTKGAIDPWTWKGIAAAAVLALMGIKESLDAIGSSLHDLTWDDEESRWHYTPGKPPEKEPPK
jgi:hypothetical protein